MSRKVTTLARRMAKAHNRIRRSVLEDGVLVFSPGAFSVEPLEDTPAGMDIERLPLPVADHYVTPTEVQKWLDEHRAWQAEAYEKRDQLREERRARHAIRMGQRDVDYGHTNGAANCFSCGAFKSKPSSVCSQCGDDPVGNDGAEPSDQARREFDRAHGRSGR